MKTGALLPPTATFTLRLPHVWMLFSSAMQIRCAWLWPECCFSSVSQVHILYANTEVRIFIWSWSNSLFLRPFILSVSVSIFLSQSVFCCCFHFVDKTVFLCSKSSFVVLKVPHLLSSSKTPSIIQHTYLFSVILSSKNVFFHSATILSCPLYISHLPSINPSSIQTTFPFPCGTKLIEDDWFFPGCSDPALVSRQQELEEELAQSRGLGQHRVKKLAAPAQRSLQVGGQVNVTVVVLWYHQNISETNASMCCVVPNGLTHRT